jgi:Zn-dependent M28 family amino/carboxypeptidase
MAKWLAISGAVILAAGSAIAAPVDLPTVNRIIDTGFNHSALAESASYLADQIGGRMTNSPAMRKAEAWTQAQFKSYGLKDVRKQGFDFGRGWWIESHSTRLISPRPLVLKSIPVAWTPPTNGPLTAPILVAPIKTERDFAEWRGKLAGKIVLVTFPAPERDDIKAPFERLNDADLAKLDKYQQPVHNPAEKDQFAEFLLFANKLDAFLAEEGALAQVRMSRLDGRLVHGEGYAYQKGATLKLPAVELAAEDYRKLTRLAKSGEVKIEINNQVHFEDQDPQAYNILADLPGSDGKSDYVMAGAHLDSWVAGDGAADNGAGSLVVMEAARILAGLNVKPKRTIRFALWAGEEQGLLGSAAYVDTYLAKRPMPKDPKKAALGPYFSHDLFPITTLPGHADLAAYFNLDNGSGKIRGIYTEGNVAVVPVLRDWLTPFASMGATSVVSQPTGGTDHELMTYVGIPAFQFIQDPLDYGARVHHTDLDVYDHLRLDDLRQAAVIMATLLLDAANSDAPLPRQPVATEPKATDPFAYQDPDKK